MSDTNPTPTPELPVIDMFIFTEILPSLLEVLAVMRDEVDLEAIRAASESYDTDNEAVRVAGNGVVKLVTHIQGLIAVLDEMVEQRDGLLASLEDEA